MQKKTVLNNCFIAASITVNTEPLRDRKESYVSLQFQERYFFKINRYMDLMGDQ